MSKKETNSFIFEEDKINNDFFEEDNEEDKMELKNIHNILTNSENKIEEEDDNKDLNNITSVSETDKVYFNEVKDGTKKSQESEYEIENELNETSLTNKNFEDEEKNHKDLDDNLENNKINNEEIIKNDLELSNICKSNKNNLNIDNQILKGIEEDDFLLNKKNDFDIKGKKYKKNRNKSPIFFIRKIKKRSKKIQLLRKKKGLHLIRKKDSDTIRKKIKTYFHNYLLDLMNAKLSKLKLKNNINNFEDIINSKKTNLKIVNKFLKFNNKFTTNVSINTNRNLLMKKISIILMNEPISTKYKAYDLKNNYYLAKYLLSMKQTFDIHKLLNLTYMELFNEFLKSSNYENIVKKVKNRDGEVYMHKFILVSNNYITYFNSNKTRKEPKDELNKKVFYKDKTKENPKNETEKSNISNNHRKNESLGNKIEKETSNYKIKNIQGMLNISNVNNNNISLVEDFQDFFGNQLSVQENSDNEIDYECNNSNIYIKNTKTFEFINNFNKQDISMLSNFIISNKAGQTKKFSENCDFFLEESKNFNNNESDFLGEKKCEIFFDKNNISEIADIDFEKEKSYIFEKDNSFCISKKRTSDYSRTNESDYTSMKFNEIANKDNINKYINKPY